MSCLIKALLLAGLVLVPDAVLAFTPCQKGLSGITFWYGTYDPPGSMAPDSQSLRPGMKWPEELIEQGWHNLRKLDRPLRLVCRYKDAPDETIVLPEKTDACFLRYGKSGLVVTCQ